MYKLIATPEELQERIRRQYRKVPVEKINIISQVRKTFENLEGLAQSIDTPVELINPLSVASFSRKEARKHLGVINKLWGSNHELEELVSFRGRFLVLIAGERRLRAIREHTKRQKASCIIFRSIPPMLALQIQFEENLHQQPSANEEARALVNLFNLLREVDPGLTITHFAEEVAERRPGTVRSALRFCNLPQSAQELVDDGTIPYGVGVELSRLSETKLKEPEKEIMIWALDSVVRGWTVGQCREKVSRFIEDLGNGQGTLFELSEEQIETARRQIVGEDYLRQLFAERGHLMNVFNLYQEGQLGSPGSIFSERSPAKQMGALIALQRKVLTFLPLNSRKRAETEAIIADLEASMTHQEESAEANLFH